MSYASTGIYSREEFAAQQAAGNFHPTLTYERYLEIRRLRAERSRAQRIEVNGTNVIEEAPESDTTRKAGGLMSGVASKAITLVN